MTIKGDKLPASCFLNNLEFDNVPPEILCLNDNEKMLIQRAKCFQTVQKMGTVSKKNIPNKAAYQKVVGRVVHLPLPIEETLKKICKESDPINLHHEMHVLVRSLPNKNNVVWESIVNMDRVFNALKWLKSNNPLYSAIDLPDSAANLKKLLEKAPPVQYEDIAEEEISDGTSKPTKDKKKKVIDIHDKNRKAMFTQVSQSNSYYENVTIYPLQEQRVNDSDTNLYQQVKIHEKPLDRNVKEIDTMCFPDIFPQGKSAQHHPRKKRLRDCDFIKVVLMHKRARFRRNKQYLFHLLNDCTMRQLNGGIFQALNVVNPKAKLSKKKFLQKLKEYSLEADLKSIANRLKNSKQYWNKVMCDLTAKIFHHGPATFFMTVSPSEWMNTQLMQYIRDINEDIDTSKMSPGELIALDPVSVARFMDIQFLALLDALYEKNGPLGKIKYHFWRREYQQRGMMHFHLLLWGEDAPELGKSPDSDVAEFIQKYTTCALPDKNISPLLHERVTRNQVHHHNDYCTRTKKVGKGIKRICRFGFPRPQKENFELSTVQKSVSGRRNLKSHERLYHLPRDSKEVNINDYNPAVLSCWNGNMDIQYIGDSSTALTIYLTKYVLKPEKTGKDENLMDNIQMNGNLYSVLWSLAMRMLTHRECGVFEAADSCLGFSLYGFDRHTVVKWLNVFMIRNKRLKTKKELEPLDDDDTDIFFAHFIDTYYANRPAELESLNLYDYATDYEVQNNQPKNENTIYYLLDDGKYLKHRKNPQLVNHYKFKQDSQPEQYFYALLLLFKPWRETEELKADFETYAEAFLAMKDDLKDALRYHEKLHGRELDLENMKKLIEEENLKQNEDGKNCHDPVNDIDEVLTSVRDDTEMAMKDFKDAADLIVKDNYDWEQALASANADQVRVYNTLMNDVASTDKVCRIHVTGEAGTGKSFLIELISHAIKYLHKKDVAIMAPTGLAAASIKGLTIHRLLRLPIEQGRTPAYTPLSDSELKFIRSQLKNVAVIIIDEVSMVSNLTLLYIHLRLTEIFNTYDDPDGFFGKIHMLVFGDLCQLPPVNEGEIFEPLSKRQLSKYCPSIGTFHLWFLFKYDELRINMRQRGDEKFRGILSNIRLGIATRADTEILNERRMEFVSSNIVDRLNELCNSLIKKLPPGTVCILPTNSMCDSLNNAMLRENANPEIVLMSNDLVESRVHYLRNKALKELEKKDEGISRTAGLARVIRVKVGASVIIRRNIDVTKGLVNGTICTFESVSKSVNGEIEGINLRLSNNTVVTIDRVKVKFEINKGVMVTREQFPINLSYAITVHKSQGLSLDNVVLDAGEVNFACGQVYVGMSRVTSINGLHLINFDPSKVIASERALVEYNRLRKTYKPNIDLYKLDENCGGDKQFDRVWTVSKAVLAAQDNCLESEHYQSLILKGLPNKENVFDYVNVCVQILFHSRVIRGAISGSPRDNILRRLFEEYKSMGIKDLAILRTFAGTEYVQEVQQDPKKFLSDLFLKFDNMKTLISNKLAMVTQCNGCNESFREEHIDDIITLDLPNSANCSIEKIFKFNFNDQMPVNFYCNICKKETSGFIKKRIITCNKILVFFLSLHNQNETNQQNNGSNISIKGVPTFKSTILEKTYHVISSVFRERKHYYCMTRNEKSGWTCISDEKVLSNKQWPRNSKGAYMIILEEKPKRKT